MIALFVWLLFRAFAIGRQAARLERPFAALVAQGIGVWIGVQAFINMGVNMGVLPTKGLTLPLLSFGGSGIVANCVALAILLRIDYENRQLLRGFDGMSAARAMTHRDDHGRRHRRPRVSRPRGRGEAACARGWRVVWLGTRDGMEATLVPQHGVEFEGVSFRGVRGKGLRTLLLGPYALLAACVDSARDHPPPHARRRARLRRLRVVSRRLMGVGDRQAAGAARANAVAGLANRVLAYGADRILLGFPDALRGRHAKQASSGSAIRCATRSPRCRRPTQRFAGRDGPLRLLVVGGSLGAQALNERVPAALALLPAATRPRVVHQAGARHIDALRDAYAQRAASTPSASPFIDDMAARYARADLVICRAGALTVAELAAAGLGAIVVPLPGAIADEQSANAHFLVDAGAALEHRAGRADAGAPRRDSSRRSTRDSALDDGARRAHASGERDAAERVADACVALGVAAMKHKVKRVHFVGIGGAGMSGIAEVLLTLGYRVTRLRSRRERGHAPSREARRDDRDRPRRGEHRAAPTRSSSRPRSRADNPEVVAARERGIPVVPRALMLAELMRLKQGIAVAGTHGKTTTTSLDRVGARRRRARSDVRDRRPAARRPAPTRGSASGEFIVAEADESDASFLYLQPVLAVVTNIDADHMETYDHDFAQADARVRRFPAAPAVLRRRGAVHRRPARARDPARRSPSRS